MIVFQEMGLQNIGPFKDVTFDWSLPGLTFIGGANEDTSSADSNGSGKSHLFKGLTWILYGRVADGEQNDALVSVWAPKATGYLHIIVDDAFYRIERTQGKRGGSLVLYQEGKDISAATMVDTQAKIVQILDMDFITLRSTVLYGQNDLERFASIGTKDADRKLILRRALRIDSLDIALEWVKGRRTTAENTKRMVEAELPVRRGVLEKLNGDIERASASLHEVVAKRKDLQSRLASRPHLEESLRHASEAIAKHVGAGDDFTRLSEERATLLERKKTLRTQIDSNVSHINEVQAAINTRQGLLDRSVQRVHEIEELRSVGDDFTRLDADLSALKTKSLDLTSQIQQLDRDIAVGEGRLGELKKQRGMIDGGSCPTCGTPTSSDSIQSRLAEIQDYCQTLETTLVLNKRKVETLRAEVRLLCRNESRLAAEHQTARQARDRCALLDQAWVDEKPSLAKWEKEIEAYKTDQDSTRQNNALVRKDLATVCERLPVLDSEIQSARDRMSERDELCQIEQELKTELQALAGIAGQIEILQKQEATENDNLILLGAAQAECHAGICLRESELEDVDGELTHLEFWIKGFGNSGLTSYILDTVLSELTEAANGYLGILADGDITVRFDTETQLKGGGTRDKFRIEVDVEGAGNVTPSGGQWKKIEIACGLALMDLVARRERAAINMLLLDECLDGLDQAGQMRVVDLLLHLRQKRSSIFVISHSSSIPDIFERSIVVRKKNRVSELIAA
jgi:DNA repair exonuclease SbcCD ATPase subunit